MFKAHICKVFIASPGDVMVEREIIRKTLWKWNSINAESTGLILLPMGWDLNLAPEVGMNAQQYIDETLLYDCDLLIGVFWKKAGAPTKQFKSGTIEEITLHAKYHKKAAMLYFSQKPVVLSEFDSDEYKKLMEFKESIMHESLYHEYKDENEFEKRLLDDIQSLINKSKYGNRYLFRSRWDSDVLADIKDDKTLAVEIRGHFHEVAFNLLKNIYEQYHDEIVWEAIVDKLSESPPKLKDSLIYLAEHNAYRHLVYIQGTKRLASVSQQDFGNFMNSLASINIFEFRDLLNNGLLKDGIFKEKLIETIKKNKLD